VPQPSEVAIRPFRSATSEAVLADLKARLANSRYTDQLEGVGWSYGIDFHLPFLRFAGLTLNTTFTHCFTDRGGKYFTAGAGLGWTFF